MIFQDKTRKIIGTLIPMSSLASSTLAKNDNGTFAAGLVFLDWLKKTHQSAWQLLPLYQTQLEPGSATKHIPSPYKSYGIGLDPRYLPEEFVSLVPTSKEKKDFVEKNHEWIHDYGFFCALRDFFKTDDWRLWDENLRNRDKTTLNTWKIKLKTEIDTHIDIQWRLHHSYELLREKATKLHISLMGDLSFYLSIQSPLVWAHQEAFQIEKNGTMKYVSGVPSLRFGRQVWGHPLYNWEKMDTSKALVLWKMRLSYMAQLFDVVRFDHARGFFQYGAMDLSESKNDSYKKGPGGTFFKELIEFNTHNGLKSFVEDCGRDLEELWESMRQIHVPGVKIFCFSMIENEWELNHGYADIAHYPENTVAYTTMHDTKPLVSYLGSFNKERKQLLADTAGVLYESDNKVFAKTLRDAVVSSPAHTVIIPIQDWLLSTDRINIPGTERAINDRNWNFHLKTPIEDLPTTF